MDWTQIWTLIETLSDWLYQPFIFWCAPFLPAVVLDFWKMRRDIGAQ